MLIKQIMEQVAIIRQARYNRNVVEKVTTEENRNKRTYRCCFVFAIFASFK